MKLNETKLLARNVPPIYRMHLSNGSRLIGSAIETFCKRKEAAILKGK